MLVTVQSILTGIEHTKELNITEQQLQDWQKGDFILDAMPTLNSDEREFLISGITPEEWAQFCKDPQDPLTLSIH
jgi:hypothetical protein